LKKTLGDNAWSEVEGQIDWPENGVAKKVSQKAAKAVVQKSVDGLIDAMFDRLDDEERGATG